MPKTRTSTFLLLLVVGFSPAAAVNVYSLESSHLEHHSINFGVANVSKSKHYNISVNDDISKDLAIGRDLQDYNQPSSNTNRLISISDSIDLSDSNPTQNKVAIVKKISDTNAIMERVTNMERYRGNKSHLDALSKPSIDDHQIIPYIYNDIMTTNMKRSIADNQYKTGLVSVNTEKSMYKLGEPVVFDIVVLDGSGYPVCDSKMRMTIKDPRLDVTTLYLGNGIAPSTSCGLYHASYDPVLKGNYTVNIIADTLDGIVAFSTNFVVKNSFDFDVIRTADTKIDPQVFTVFTVTVNIASHVNTGIVNIREFVPSSFNVKTDGTITVIGDTKIISWYKSMASGRSFVQYSYSVPLEFPKLYTLGPMQIIYGKDNTFTEGRPWFVANDPGFTATPSDTVSLAEKTASSIATKDRITLKGKASPSIVAKDTIALSKSGVITPKIAASDTISLSDKASTGAKAKDTVSLSDSAFDVIVSGTAMTVNVSPTDPLLSINLPLNITSATINYGTSPVTLSNALDVTATNTYGNFEVSIPAGITISGPGGWTGTVNLPSPKPLSSVAVPSGTAANSIIEIGLATGTLTFDSAHPVKIVFSGDVAKRIGFSTNGGSLTEITTVCTSDSSSGILAGHNECKIDAGSDLHVWTLHFTSYVVFSSLPHGAGGSTPGVPPSFTTGFAQDEYPLTINGNTYKLPNYTNTGPLNTITVDSPFTIKVMLYGDVGPSSVKHVSLFTNMRGNYASLVNSDTVLSWDATQPLQVSDPNHFFGPVTVNATVVGNKLQVTFNGTFAKPMPVSDIGIRTWGYDLYSQDVYIINAWQATAGIGIIQSKSTAGTVSHSQILNTTNDIIPKTNTKNTTNQSTGTNIATNASANDLITTVKEWAGYSSTAISDSQLLQSMGYQGNHVPTWVIKNGAKYLVNGEITQRDFSGIIKYLVDNHIVK